MLDQLKRKIEERTAKIAVIGLGYVGLPVACEFAQAGFNTLGVDILADRIKKINAGISPIEGNEPGLAELLDSVIGAGKLQATMNYTALTDRDVVLINVETPVDEQHIPHYHALQSVLKDLGPVLKDGALVIVESTIAPGTMHKLVLPQLEEYSGKKINEGFYLGNCPERVMPGKLLHNLRNLSRVLGGMTPETAEAMRVLYSPVVNADLDTTDSITAELVKTAENAYRDVQIAFANELALICEAAGGDVWRVRELVNKSPSRNVHLPGAGVGGHCIPKDPWLLAYGVADKDVDIRLIPAARAVNMSMPFHIFTLLEDALHEQSKQVADAQVLVMGYAYLEDSDDTRAAPTIPFVAALENAGAEVVIHDPFVEPYQGDLLEMAKGVDAAVLMVKHSEYREINLAALKAAMNNGAVFVDGRGAFAIDKLQELGFTYRVVGVA